MKPLRSVRPASRPSRPDWTSALACWVSGLEPAAIPGSTRERAKHHVLDTLGATLAGSGHSVPQLLLASSRNRSHAGSGTVVGSAYRLESEECALINGVSGHVLDLDDQSYSLMGHPSVVVLPAVLAAAEEAEASCETTFYAFIVGVEAACKLGAALNPKHFEIGWHTTATLGAFGAAVGCAWLWKLDPGSLANSLGLVPGMAGGLRANNGTEAKSYQAGQAAQAGLRAVNLTRSGLTASRRVLEAQDGFIDTANSGHFDVSAFGRLGDPFDFDLPGIMIKRYPCCSGLGAAIDAVLQLSATQDFQLESVTRIECRVTPLAFRSLPYGMPTAELEGKFSAPFTLAAALVDGDVTEATYRADRLADESILRLARTVELICDESAGFAPPAGPEAASVSITTSDGASRAITVQQPVGGPGRPLSWEAIMAKYQGRGNPIRGSQWEEVAGGVKQMDGSDGIRELTRLLQTE